MSTKQEFHCKHNRSPRQLFMLWETFCFVFA